MTTETVIVFGYMVFLLNAVLMITAVALLNTARRYKQMREIRRQLDRIDQAKKRLDAIIQAEKQADK